MGELISVRRVASASKALGQEQGYCEGGRNGFVQEEKRDTGRQRKNCGVPEAKERIEEKSNIGFKVFNIGILL